MNCTDFFTDLMDSYGFCSQSLQVWSTQGWQVWSSTIPRVPHDIFKVSAPFTLRYCYCMIKGMLLYSTVSSPLGRSKFFTVCPLDRPAHSGTNSTSPTSKIYWSRSCHQIIYFKKKVEIESKYIIEVEAKVDCKPWMKTVFQEKLQKKQQPLILPLTIYLCG